MIKKWIATLSLFLSITTSYADNEVYNFYRNLDWSFFFDKLKVSFDVCTCPIENQNQWVAGFKTKFVEPIGFIETSPTPWNFVGLGIKMDNDYLRKQGVSRDKNAGNFKHAHFVIFPILGWTIGLIQDYFCFERGTIFNLAYLSEVNPAYNNDIIGLMEETAKPVSKIWFANPVAELACAADCASSEIDEPINSLYWCDGCNGSVTASDTGFARTGMPYQDSESLAYRIIDNMSLYGGMLKTKESYFSYNPAGGNLKSTLCESTYFPTIIKDQYFLQLAKGSKGWDAQNFGKLRFAYDFKAQPGDEDSNFFWLWREKDMCSGAAVCRSTFTGM